MLLNSVPVILVTVWDLRSTFALQKCEIIAKELLLEVQSLDEQLLEKFSPRVLCQVFAHLFVLAHV